jgi:hypothetical protein
MMVFCRQCGVEISETDKFCPKCGKNQSEIAGPGGSALGFISREFIIGLVLGAVIGAVITALVMNPSLIPQNLV